MDRYWLLWLPLPVMGFAIWQVMQCLLCARVSFVLGYPPSPPFVTRVWALCELSCPALITLFVQRVVSFCCSCPSSCAGVHLLPELSANMFRDPELRQLAQALPYILVHDRAASTVSMYLGAYKSWKHGHCTMLPSCLQTLLCFPSMWCVWVSYVHKKSGYPEGSEYPVVKQLLDAAKRILARPRTHMKPLFTDQVQSLLTCLEGGHDRRSPVNSSNCPGVLWFLCWDDLHHLLTSGQCELWSITCCNLLEEL